MRSNSPALNLSGVFWAGLVAGIGDLAFALTFNGLRGAQPMKVLQSIASGLLGPDSFKGGVATAVLGVLLHFVIAFIIASIFYVARRKLTLLTRRPVLCGILYGVVAFAVMRLVVLPLSAAPRFKISTVSIVSDLLSHMFLVGLPIALLIRRSATPARARF